MTETKYTVVAPPSPRVRKKTDKVCSRVHKVLDKGCKDSPNVLSLCQESLARTVLGDYIRLKQQELLTKACEIVIRKRNEFNPLQINLDDPTHLLAEKFEALAEAARAHHKLQMQGLTRASFRASLEAPAPEQKADSVLLAELTTIINM